MRRAARIAAYFVVIAASLLLVVVVTGSPSWSGFGLTLGLFVLAASMVVTQRARLVALAGVAMVGATILLRVATGNEGRDLRMYTPQRPSARIVNRLLDE